MKKLKKRLDFCRKFLLSDRGLFICDKLVYLILCNIFKFSDLKQVAKDNPEFSHLCADIQMIVGGICSAYATYLRGISRYSLNDIAYCVDRDFKSLIAANPDLAKFL